MTDASHVRRAAELCTRFLSEAHDPDWSSLVPDLDMTAVQVVAHTAEGCLWYAIDLSAGGQDLDLVEHRIKPDSEPRLVVDTLAAYANVVASVIEAAPDSARGFHPMGTADPSGFAAMACDEMLIHTSDAANGFGLDFEAPADLAEAVLRRLFPWVSVDDDPWMLLRWANGRIERPDRARLSDWVWHCAPLSEWDGSEPATTT